MCDVGAPWVVLPGEARSPVLLHVPHSATAIPPDVRARLLLDDAALAAELGRMTDAGTAELADAAATAATQRPWRFVNGLSRLTVDPERLPDDREELRSRGMSAVYTRTSHGALLRDDDPEHEADLLSRYFTLYADALADAVDERLRACDRVVLLDVHSFPAQALPYELHVEDRRPQVCLGVDDAHTPARLLAAARQAFGGLDVEVDQPFRGTYVPLRHHGRDLRVASLMVEVRRDCPPDGPAVVAGLTRLIDAAQDLT